MAIISIKDLTFSYTPDTPALQKVSLIIEEGQLVLLCGPTGSGKSTLLRCINGLIPYFHRGNVYGGSVVVDGIPVENSTIGELSRVVGFVFQNPENQLVSLNVERELAFGPENLGLKREITRERVENTLQKLKITHLRDISPFSLSGGEQQRVAIAAVLAMKPKILLLDEPTSNLDPKMAKTIIDLLVKLNEEEKTTIIITEHRLDLILPLVHQVIALKNGKILARGTPENIVSDKNFIGSGIDLPQIVQTFLAFREKGLFKGDIPISIEDALLSLEKIVAGDGS